MNRPTIAVDFHGVICDHPTNGNGATQLDWPEVKGAIDWLRDITRLYDVHITSARFADARSGGESLQIAGQWLHDHGLPSHLMDGVDGEQPRIIITSLKPRAILTIDDRAFLFRGKFPTSNQVAVFTPWNRGLSR